MSEKNRKIILALLAGVMLVLFVRFFIGGDEDTWICKDGQWIKHGNPSASKPLEKCK